MATIEQLSDFLSDIKKKIDNLSLSNRSEIDAALIARFLRSKQQLEVARDKETANQLRECMFQLRRAVDQIRPAAPDVESLKMAIHEALRKLTVKFPLNKINEKGELLCPLSGGPFGDAVEFALSNGYIYLVNEFKEEARITRKKPYFTQLGNISQYDVDLIHGWEKSEMVVGYALPIITSPLIASLAALFLQTLSMQFLSIGILGVAQLSLVAATGLTMAVAGGIIIGLFVLSGVVASLYFAGKAIYETYRFDKKYSSTLEPDKSTSTNKMLNVMDGTPSRERQNLEVDQSNDAVLVPLLPSQDVGNEVELGVVAHQEQQVTKDASYRFNV